MDLDQKYPLFSLLHFDWQKNALSKRAFAAQMDELWRRQRVIIHAGAKYARNVELFLGSRLHDSKVISIKFENECLAIHAEDYYTFDFFCAVKALLGFDLPDEKICCPVLIRLEDVNKLNAYTIEEEGLVPTAIGDALPKITEYLYDEVTKISRSGISIGFILYNSILLDIDARHIRIEENLADHFTLLFGSDNIDIFDAYWQARKECLAGWGTTEFMIRLIRSLRPKMPESYDVHNFYIWSELKMHAEDAAKKGKLNKAVEIFTELLPTHWNPFIIWEKLGECLFKLKRYEEAMLYLYAVLGYGIRATNARYLLAQIYYRQGNLDDAADSLMECLKIDPKFSKAKRFIKQHNDIREYIEAELMSVDE